MKFNILAVLGAAVALAGCNTNFQPVGTPTAYLSVPQSQLKNSPITRPDPTDNTKSITIDDWNLTATIEVRTAPGSPAGTVGNFVLSNGTVLASSVSFDACPIPSAPSAPLCGPAKINLGLGFGQIPPAFGSLRIVSYTVTSYNGLSATVTLTPPVGVL